MLAERRKFILYSEAPDAAPANQRRAAYMFESMPRNTLYHFSRCAVLLVHRIVANAVREEAIIGDCYAVHFILEKPAIQQVLLRALRALVHDELSVARRAGLDSRSVACATLGGCRQPWPRAQSAPRQRAAGQWGVVLPLPEPGGM